MDTNGAIIQVIADLRTIVNNQELQIIKLTQQHDIACEIIKDQEKELSKLRDSNGS